MRALPVLVLLLLVPGAAGLPWNPHFLSPPWADFSWSPDGVPAGETITFVSTSADPDGVVVLHRWHVPGDDETTFRLGSTMEHAFAKRGAYPITLEVWDNALQTSSVTQTVIVANSPPVPSMAIDPSPTYRGVPVVLAGFASDVDGDAIVNWAWDLGDGSVAFGQNVTHAYASLGLFPITLHAMDEVGGVAGVSQPLRVVNQPPVVVGGRTPQHPVTGQQVQFFAEGTDPDLPGGAVSFTWHFSDGAVLFGAGVIRVYEQAGDYSVTLRGEDSEGAVSAPFVMSFHVSG